jgi:hypothetical protein
VARRDGEYQRGGTANVFCGVQPKAGWYFPKVTAHPSSPEFADYLLEVAILYPEAHTIHLVQVDPKTRQRAKWALGLSIRPPSANSPLHHQWVTWMLSWWSFFQAPPILWDSCDLTRCRCSQ